MSGDREDRSEDELLAPPGWEASWNTPASGETKHNPKLRVCVQADFPSDEAIANVDFAQIIGDIVETTGDHEVCVESRCKASVLFRMPLPWRTKPYRTGLRAAASELAKPEFWELVRPALAEGFTVEAFRGGGKHRHLAWKLGIEPTFIGRRSSLSLGWSARHVSQSHAEAIDSICVRALTAAHDAGAVYGRAGIDLPASDRDPPFNLMPGEDLWQSPSIRTGPFVPWLYPYNLLSSAHLDKLGPIDPARLEPESHRRDALPLLRPLERGALLSLGRLHQIAPMLTEGGSTAQSPTPLNPFVAWLDRRPVWLLSRCVQAGMLAVQQADLALADDQARYVEARTQIARGRSTKVTPLKPFHDRAPACVCGRVEEVKLEWWPKALRDVHQQSHVFMLPEDERGKGMLVYGATAKEPGRLNPPIMVGSLDPQRCRLHFDPVLHGWDAASDTEPKRAPKRRLSQLVCPNCQGRHFAVHAAFEYPDDLDESLEGEQRAHPEDFFTWFWLVCRCVGCNAERIVADIECA